ncbi:hypothetical protein UG56_004710 [Nocardioides luteus]|uniref:Lycopene cyclase domain-containing protein n=1 Tax=Nocardioides luteus TaxID=1844 RepID=A0A1J4N9B3_9ACTN|nr:hypothetical protein UG56_004710 [Nocardioides luteus]
MVAVAAVTTAGLAADRFVDARGQAWLGLGCTALFVVVARRADVHERRQALVVVAVATFFEVVGAQLWGLYDYRLGNLPLFVPAGHGLVFLTGLRLSQVPLLVRHRDAFVRVTAVVATAWAVLGAAGLLGTRDLSGAVGSALVVVMLARGRQAGLFAGVWWFVAYLELYGTAIGTWTWSPVVPGLGLPAGNPPSGVASGYVVFDWLAGVLVAGATRFARAAATTG